MTANTTKSTVLLTGGTGLVGSAIIEAMNDMQVISLTRHGADGWTAPSAKHQTSASGLLATRHGHIVPASDNRHGVVQIQGDVTRPLLGLDEPQYEELARRVDVVLHAAGVSDYRPPSASPTVSMSRERERSSLSPNVPRFPSTT